MRAFSTPLPIDAALPALVAALQARNVAVLAAPPGAGKTTRVPLVLADEPWANGKILVLEPRRLAARAAASRMAQTCGEPLGGLVGLRVRFGSQVSARTRIEVITEGVFTRLILDDPALTGIAAVLFDEFHERSLDADLALALARETQVALRDDLRLLVMSATLDTQRIAALLGGAPVVESAGRAFPVETRYVGRDSRTPIEAQVAATVARALASEAGSVLAFLPGAGEIRRTERMLRERVSDPDIDIVPLFGALDRGVQDAAIAPAAPGRRKVVLATAIAETSITIEGVRVVVDSGLARVPRYEPDVGQSRLETVRVSRAAADQRRGRAGRTGPGLCYRLWDEPETASLIHYAPPEILSADLTGFMLDLAQCGIRDPAALPFLDPPPRPAVAQATALLRSLGALDADGRITPEGVRLRSLPVAPRLARMIAAASDRGHGRSAAEIAAILSERGLGGDDVDLAHRVAAFRRDRSERGAAARAAAVRWAASAVRTGGASAPSPLAGEGGGGGLSNRGTPKTDRAALQPGRQSASENPTPNSFPQGRGEKSAAANDLSPGALLALAYPDRIARNRGGSGGFLLANGRGGSVDPASPLASAPFLAVAEITGSAAQGRIVLAAALSLPEIEAAFAGRIEARIETAFDATSASVRARSVRRLGAIRLADAPAPVEPTEEAARLLADGIVQLGLEGLPWTSVVRQWRDRVRFIRAIEGDPWPDLDDAALVVTAADWLVPALSGKTALEQFSPAELGAALEALAPWSLRVRLDREAPTHFDAPSGSRLPIDYGDPAGPKLAVRVQELFGLARHPSIASGRAPLVLELLSPAHRPVQVTRDLPGFWRGSYAAVRTEMRGRYPRHPWPDDPLSAPPTRRAKPRA